MLIYGKLIKYPYLKMLVIEPANSWLVYWAITESGSILMIAEKSIVFFVECGPTRKVSSYQIRKYVGELL